MMTVIRILRKVPRTAKFDQHLTDCAFASICHDEPLTVGKIFGLEPLDTEFMTIGEAVALAELEKDIRSVN